MIAYLCCKDCEFRHYLCHADCPNKAAADAVNEAMKKAMNEKLPVRAYSCEKKRKSEKKRRQHRKT